MTYIDSSLPARPTCPTRGTPLQHVLGDGASASCFLLELGATRILLDGVAELSSMLHHLPRGVCLSRARAHMRAGQFDLPIHSCAQSSECTVGSWGCEGRIFCYHAFIISAVVKLPQKIAD
jgi:hypothetical protein